MHVEEGWWSSERQGPSERQRTMINTTICATPRMHGAKTLRQMIPLAVLAPDRQ